MPLSIIFQLYRGGILIRTIAISKIHETPKYKIIKTKNTINSLPLRTTAITVYF
jgi:hypothetical protein